MSHEADYWLEKAKTYIQEGWADQPSLFAQFCISYFPPHGSILELGAGAGQDSLWFASKGYKVAQTDLVKESLEYSLKSAIKQGFKLESKVVDLNGSKLPFETSSFDVIYAHLSLHYFDQTQTKQIFNEIYRILKPGGILAALFNSVTDPEYGDGEKLEDDLFLVKGIRKRYLTEKAAKEFVSKFKILLTDDKGESYKDKAKGVTGQIRLVAEKEA